MIQDKPVSDFDGSDVNFQTVEVFTSFEIPFIFQKINKFAIVDFSKKLIIHSLIRGVLIQSCSAGTKNFTNYVFSHPQFSSVIQNIENRCAI